MERTDKLDRMDCDLFCLDTGERKVKAQDHTF